MTDSLKIARGDASKLQTLERASSKKELEANTAESVDREIEKDKQVAQRQLTRTLQSSN